MMKRISGFLIGLGLLLTATTAYGVDEIAKEFYFNDSVAGQKITIQGTFKDPGNRKVVLTDVSTGTSRDVNATVPATGDSLSFDLPTDLNNGRYKVAIRLIAESGVQPDVPVPGELRVPVPPALAVTVATVQPKDPYPNPAHGNKYDFEIAGTNFATDLQNNHLEINGLPIALAYKDPQNKALPPCDSDFDPPCLSASEGNQTRKLLVEGYLPPGFSHPLEVAVRVGNGENVAKAPTPLVFSEISKTRLKIYAVGAFVALLGILYLLVRAGIRLGKVNGEKYGSLRAFLIDKETNSYSLSKFQLTLFTLVTVFGYIYVFVCRLFVQWVFELPPVPEGLPGMMAVSLGTTVVAAGIGAKIGGKGAGPESPSLADLITSGGVVLPERFQFFLWTIVSSVGVLVLILASDPVTVNALPKLPDGMLYLMGLSSAGYLGGKLVRGPGPSIKSVDAEKVVVGPKAASGGKPAEPGYTGLQFTLTGDNLAIDATFQLDDERIPAAQVVVIEKTEENQSSKLCSMLKVHLKNVAENYFEGTHQLRIVNPDSQGAEIKYGTTVDPVSGVVAGNAPVKVKVTGANFKDPSKAVWTDQAGTVTAIPETDIKKVSENELEITLTPGAAGKATLAIESPGKLTTTIEVTVA
jgi:hypothetical protein